MQKEELTQGRMAQLLPRSEQAHAAYESTLGLGIKTGQLVCNLYHQQVYEGQKNATMTFPIIHACASSLNVPVALGVRNSSHHQ